jgi:hypothetical protein
MVMRFVILLERQTKADPDGTSNLATFCEIVRAIATFPLPDRFQFQRFFLAFSRQAMILLLGE